MAEVTLAVSKAAVSSVSKTRPRSRLLELRRPAAEAAAMELEAIIGSSFMVYISKKSRLRMHMMWLALCQCGQFMEENKNDIVGTHFNARADSERPSDATGGSFTSSRVITLALS
eukprot:scaffold876_cov108-Skeletonema_marinoi.AAC.1